MTNTLILFYHRKTFYVNPRPDMCDELLNICRYFTKINFVYMTADKYEMNNRLAVNGK